MAEVLKKTLANRAEVLEGLPEHPAMKAVLAWNGRLYWMPGLTEKN